MLYRRYAPRDWDEGKHPREPAGTPEGGQFTSDGGGGDGEGEKPEAAAIRPPDPEVINVGGDKWNRDTAKRLEIEFQEARPKVEKIEQDAVGASVATVPPGEEPEEEPFIPEEWDALSGHAQEQAKDEYVSWAKDSYVESEQNYYYEEYAPHEARQLIAENFNDGSDTEWAKEALAELRDARKEAGEKDFPFTDEQLIEALEINFEGNPGGSLKDPEFDWDDDKLSEPAGYEPTQETLPGIEPLEPHTFLTQDMRNDIESRLKEDFDKKGDDVAGDMEVPDWVTEQAEEQVGESWNDMDDGDKFEWVKAHASSIIDDESTGLPEGQTTAATMEEVDALPNKYDPLNETSGTDYRRTQRLARHLSVERAMEVLRERGLVKEYSRDEIGTAQLRNAIARIDTQLWEAWKGSSTSEDGITLQLATADELGGRLREEQFRKYTNVDRAKIEARADRIFEKIGGYDGVKAYVRAKWETTQYLLDKAGIKTLNIYRGIEMDRETFQKLYRPSRRRVIPYETFLTLRHYPAHQLVQGPDRNYDFMPTLPVERNGAASTTTDIDVANGWKAGSSSKITLRAQVPRTAAVSIPAYGINVHSEHEVVVAGVGWHGWDAWAGKAPPLGTKLGTVPLMQAA